LLLICGIAVVDIIASRLPKVASPGELVFTPIQTSIGGHACNVSVDLAQMRFPKTKLQVVFPVGKDVFGIFLEKRLKDAGLKLDVFRTSSASTSLDLILVIQGEDRRFHTDPGANQYLSPGHVLKIIKREKPILFYTGGIGLPEKFDEKLEEVLEKAKMLSAITFVDIVAPYQKTWDFLKPAFRWIDIFHCNEDEAREITESKNLEEASEEISKLGAKFSFITIGAKGLLAKLPNLKIRMPAFKVQVVDPTGAGDAFCAGLILQIYRLLESKVNLDEMPQEKWKKILLYASACGAACCQGVGTTSAVKPKFIQEIIQEQGQELLKATKVKKL
jgi:ribokinase